MSKAVLISIQPKWCELIASGEKTLEVRKTKPKLKPPFKCYIYETNGKGQIVPMLGKTNEYWTSLVLGKGKIIGEFICDGIYYFGNLATDPWSRLRGSNFECFKKMITYDACLTESEFRSYQGRYGWHISDLVIYDKPKELSEFFSACNKPARTDCSKCVDKREQSCKPITRPPQSWCYVETHPTEKGGVE